jgi:hypothetical protein
MPHAIRGAKKRMLTRTGQPTQRSRPVVSSRQRKTCCIRRCDDETLTVHGEAEHVGQVRNVEGIGARKAYPRWRQAT